MIGWNKGTLTILSNRRWPSTSWWSQTTRRPRPRRRKRPSHPRPPATRRSPASSKISLILPLPWKCVSTDPRIRTSKGLSGAFAPKYTGIEAILSGINLVTFLVSIPSSFPPKYASQTHQFRERSTNNFFIPPRAVRMYDLWPCPLFVIFLKLLQLVISCNIFHISIWPRMALRPPCSIKSLSFDYE